MHKLRSHIGLFTATLALFGATSVPARAFDLFGWLSPKQEVSAPVDVQDPVRYSVELNASNPSLEETLRNNSILFKEIATPASGTTGLVTRARIDQKRLITTLYAEAYYGGTIDILINGRPLEQISLDQNLSGTAPKVSIKVATGPLFRFAAPQVKSSAGPIDLSPFGLSQGELAKSPIILSAEEQLVADWNAKGYPFAKVTNRTIEADHNTNLLEVGITFDPGVKANIGVINVAGNKDVNTAFIIEQADIIVGSPYSPDQLERAQKRLQEAGVFDSVVVSTADTPSPDGTVAVSIDVSERKPRTIGVGATAGNIDGLGVEAFWQHRNLFGNGEGIRVEGSVGRIGQGNINNMDFHTSVLYYVPNLLGPGTRFETKASFDVVNTNAFTKRSGKLEAYISNDLRSDLTLKGGLAGEYAVINDGIATTNTSIFSAPVSLTYDTRNNPLNPSSGWHAELLAEPTYVLPNHASFVKASLEASTYYALDQDEKLILAARGALGSIIGTDIANVPADRRFFAGGSGSIRGYGFQMAGPLTAGGKPSGGLSFAEASLEARYQINKDFGVVAFVDSGGAFTSNIPGQGGSIYTGYGAGVRYFTPFGPIRADIAFPLTQIAGQPQYGLYLGVGQAF